MVVVIGFGRFPGPPNFRFVGDALLMCFNLVVDVLVLVFA